MPPTANNPDLYLCGMYISENKKKKKEKNDHSQFSAEFVWELSSPEYVVCQCFT